MERSEWYSYEFIRNDFMKTRWKLLHQLNESIKEFLRRLDKNYFHKKIYLREM